MTYNQSSHKHLFILLVIGLLVLFTVNTTLAQVMPDYQRLDSITSNINAPTAVSIDQYGNVYVAESINNRVLIYTQSGAYERTLMGLNKPLCVSVDNTGRIFVGNKNSGNVAVYNSGLSFQFNLGAASGEFGQPNDIAIDHSNGNVYVADRTGAVVKVYNPDNPNTVGDPSDSFKFSFDGTANGGGLFNTPTSIEIDELAGQIIVLDHPLYYSGDYLIEGARIQMFDMDGNFISGFNKAGSNVGDLHIPMHVAVDSDGRLYVTDSSQNGVFVYKKDGTYLGTIYDEDYPIRNALGIALGVSNRLHIALPNYRQIDRYGILPYTVMEISPLALTFSGQRGAAIPAPQDVVIGNSGSAALNWTANTEQSWITLSALSGTTVSIGTSTLSIGMDFDGLAAGSYSGTVSIVSDSGASEVISISLELSDVVLIANPGGTYYAVEGEPILLDASNSSGAITLYEWDIDSNGTYEYSTTLVTQSHTYTVSGLHSITLRVTDDFSNTHVSVPTLAYITDAAPTAAFTGSQLTGAMPLTVDFTNSSSGYDQPLTHSWDFDADGNEDSTEENPTHIFNVAGTYTVELTVLDSDGTPDTLARSNYITVTKPYTITPSSNNFGQVCEGKTGIRAFTIENVGAGDLVIGSLSISGASASEFTLQDDTCSGQTISPTGTCTYSVQYLSASSGLVSAAVEVPITGAITEVPAIALDGEGIICPDIKVSRVLLSDEFSSGISAGWTTTGQWTSSNPCPRTIAAPFMSPWADSSCASTGGDELVSESFDTSICSSVDLIFSNQYEGAAGSAVVQVSGDNGSTWTGSLAMGANDGFPVPNEKKIDINSIAGVSDARVNFNNISGTFWAVDNVMALCRPAQLAFTAPVSMMSGPEAVIVENTGTDTLLIGTLSLAGTDPLDFIIQNDTCSGNSLLPENRCSLDVVFAPAFTGVMSADLVVPSNDPDTPSMQVALSGVSSAADADEDGIPDDGDNSGTAGDNPCVGGNTVDCDDNCPEPNPSQADTDSDGIGDDCDNCTEVFNPDQRDSNSADDDNPLTAGIQHYGNVCDPDFDNDGRVALQDYVIWRANYRQRVPPGPAELDVSGDNKIGLEDYVIWRQYYRKPPGPGIGD